MALVLKDRVRQTSTTAGTGTITLSGSVTGYQDFTVIGTGNTTYYTIADQSGSNWEVGLGTWTSPDQLSRDVVYESSNSNVLVDFGSNIKDVFVTLPAEAAPGGGVTSVTASSPVQSTGGTTPVISMPVATTSTNGYLSSTDWNTFNNKGTVTSVTATSPVSSTGGTSPVISMPAATTAVSGYLKNTDWVVFNNKQNVLVSGSNIKTVNSTSLLGSGDVSVGVTSVTATSPVASTGGATPVISMPAATTAVSGYLTSTDWNTFNGKQNALTLTTTGTSGAATLVGSTLNIPNYASGGGSGTVTQVDTSGSVSGITLTGGPITTTGTVTLGGSLDLSAPPAIGNNTPNTIVGTTINGTTITGGTLSGGVVRSLSRFTVDDTASSGYTAELGVDANGWAVIGGSYIVGGPINQPILAPAGLALGDSNNQVLIGAAPTSTYGLNFPPTPGSANQTLITDGTGNLSWSNKFVLGAGTATAGAAPLKFTSGTNLTTAEAGAIEYNGTALFSTGTAASGRGIVFAPQLVRINSTRSKATNNTNLEPIFDAANDTLDLAANTLYYFKGVYLIDTSATPSTSGARVGFLFSNTQQDISYRYFSHVIGFSTGQTSGYSSVATATAVTATGLSAISYVIEIEGWFKSNATTGGTIIPAFAQSVAGTSVAPSAAANTWLMIQPMGSPTATLLAGNWS